MKFIVRLGLLFIVLAAFLWLLCYLWAEDYLLQVIFLMCITLVSLLKLTRRQVLAQFKLILPFVLIMMAIYIILGLVGMKPIGKDLLKQSAFRYWLFYGITRSLVFANTILFLQFLLAFLTIKDIISLPININKLKYLILGKALYEKTINSLDELELHLLLIPQYQVKRKTLAVWFRMKLLLTFSIITMILSESHKKGELIDNRIKHCFGE